MPICQKSPPVVHPSRPSAGPKGFVIALVLLVAAFGFACGGSEEPRPPTANSPDEEAQLVVVDSAGESIELSLEDLRILPAVTREITREENGQSRDHEISGVLLDELLDSVAIDPREIQDLTLLAADGYSVRVEADLLADHEMIIAYIVDGESLGPDDGPLRAFIPGASSMYWVRNLSRLELSRVPVAAESLKSIIFLETASGEIESSEYGDGDLAIRTRDLVTETEDLREVRFFAADGFEKTEQLDVFLEEFLVITGETAPAFRGPELPRGMHVRDIAYFIAGNRGYYSVSRGPELLDLTDVDDERGVSFATLVAAMNLAEAETYILEAVDGYAVEVAAEDLSRGIVFVDDEGRVTSLFEDLPKNTRVRDLLTIRAAE